MNRSQKEMKSVFDIVFGAAIFILAVYPILTGSKTPTSSF